MEGNGGPTAKRDIREPQYDNVQVLFQYMQLQNPHQDPQRSLPNQVEYYNLCLFP